MITIEEQAEIAQLNRARVLRDRIDAEVQIQAEARRRKEITDRKLGKLVKVDRRGRISLGKTGHRYYLVETDDTGVIVLTPVVVRSTVGT